MFSLFSNAIISLLPLSFLMGVSGCFIVWHRLTYLCDALAHGTMLGVVLSSLLHLPPFGVVLGLTLLLGFILVRHPHLFLDVRLIILGYGSLSLAFLILAWFPNLVLNPTSYLLGDLLLVDHLDVFILCLLTVIGGLVLRKNWNAILMWSFDPELAETDGHPVRRFQTIFLIGVSILIVLSVKMIGSLLLPILLIVPASSVALVTSTPRSMMIGSIGMTGASLIIGLGLSLWKDLPSGAAISIVSIAFHFLIPRLASYFKNSD